ncbi:MAG: SUMF1/EgtB/PvdO family nonheme iron enzyme [Gammaproteobacteria bacterium]|nr:SUMF1/EgtB/PvdO family nonheme iron enzyme [Gammaproteobacteria bacterium]
MIITEPATLQRLSAAQQRLIHIVKRLDDDDYRQQFHPELSPLGWHLAHCLYIENYWLHEILCGNNTLTKGLDQLYLPELSVKTQRGAKLPPLKQLLQMAEQYQANNRQFLQYISIEKKQQHLLKDNYLQDFIIQHYDQHYETMQMILQQRALKKDYSDYTVTKKLIANTAASDTIIVPTGEYQAGSDQSVSYDNERPRHKIKINRFSIAKQPVSNQQYLAFIFDHGYQNKKLWSREGWQWLENSAVQSPQHWKQDSQQHWFGVDQTGAFDLEPEQTLSGINYYEASAFAKWSKARLPHEHEWERAFCSQHLENTGTAWEWCQNRFYPYPGFKAFPYDGYSSPWFSQPHFVLKSASVHTQKSIKRASFRNFFGPDKRHVFAGCRLAY